MLPGGPPRQPELPGAPRYNSLAIWAAEKKKRLRTPDSPPYEISATELARVDPTLDEYAKQVLIQQVGPYEAKLDEFDRIQARYQAAVNNWMEVSSTPGADKAAARKLLTDNPQLTDAQKAEEERIKRLLTNLLNDKTLFPQKMEVTPTHGVGRRRTRKFKKSRKLKKALKKTRRGKVRAYS